MGKNLKSTLNNPSLLNPLSKRRRNHPGHHRNTERQSQQICFDEKQRVFALKKVLPAGMSFPYDFGFVPSAVAEDGDAFDLLVLMDEPAFPGCLLKCRTMGIIEAKQGEKKKTIRND
jgi:inorganic pyrophosphatase